jgi:hypothetical protein
MNNQEPPIEETPDQRALASVERRGSSLPLVLTIVAVLVWFGFQTLQLALERSSLSALRANLESPMQESQKMQAQLQTLVTKTAELANQGNAGAKAAVVELEKRGIPIKSAAPQPAK